jgi:hypothetical protein
MLQVSAPGGPASPEVEVRAIARNRLGEAQPKKGGAEPVTVEIKRQRKRAQFVGIDFIDLADN